MCVHNEIQKLTHIEDLAFTRSGGVCVFRVVSV